jgi:hypothetical protein
MTDLTDILSKAPKGRKCNFGEWLDSLSQSDQDAVKKALVNPEWSAHKLTETFKEHGMTSGREAVTLHRKGMCRTCGPI